MSESTRENAEGVYVEMFWAVYTPLLLFAVGGTVIFFLLDAYRASTNSSRLRELTTHYTPAPDVEWAKQHPDEFTPLGQRQFEFDARTPEGATANALEFIANEIPKPQISVASYLIPVLLCWLLVEVHFMRKAVTRRRPD